METDVALSYACPGCCHAVHAKLHCAGRGVAEGPHVVASVKIPCPTCESVNEVIFELSGMILQVANESRLALPEPSRN